MSSKKNKTEIVMVPIDKINPYERNPRYNDETVKRLVNIIPRVGFNQPLLLDENYVIIKGHARFKAATQLGMDKVPCIISKNSDEINAFDRIADNKVHEFSKWDEVQRAHEIDMIDTDYDFRELGLSVDSMSDMPAFDFSDGDADESEDEDALMDEEERKRKFLEYLQKNNVPETPVITTQHDIDHAKEKVANVYLPEHELVSIKCQHCGHELIVRKDKYIEL